MGLCVSRDDNVEDRRTDRRINKALLKDAKGDKQVVKMLLLGTGESGKSTLFKQMIKLHGEGLSQHRLNDYRIGIRRNALESIIVLVQQARIFEESKREGCAIDPENLESVNYVLQYVNQIDRGLIEATGDHIARLWKDPALKITFSYRYEFELYMIDNAAHFLDKADKIFVKTYDVTEEDALKVRVMTNGMTQKTFVMNHTVSLLMVDVGGQRSERRKWIRWFEGVGIVLFVVAVSEYDQILFEDGKTNRFEESLQVWEEIVNSQHFDGALFMLFLNKVDLFAEKVDRFPIREHVLDYDGPELGYQQGLEYFRDRYLEVSGNLGNAVQVYYTTATDSDIMENVFATMKAVVIKRLLGEGGVM